MEMKVLFLVLLGPLSAAYDFCTNPAAPPAILVAQFQGAKPDWQPLPHPIKPVRPRKHVYVTQG